MIINQDFTVNNTSSRPYRSNNTDKDQNKGGGVTRPLSYKQTADIVELDAQRLTVSENLKASEATIPDQASAGDLMEMLKSQLGGNPLEALGAQMGNLGPGSAKLLSDN